MRQPAEDEYDDPVRYLRYAPSITTRDVADLLNVTAATVRQWVTRGYITPVGMLGSTNLFDPQQVLNADAEMAARRKAAGYRPRSDGWSVEFSRADRIKPKHYDALVTIAEAARLLDVSPATIRSWLHRGHLTRHPSSTPRTVELRLGDVIAAAQSRRLPVRGRPRGRRTA